MISPPSRLRQDVSLFFDKERRNHVIQEKVCVCVCAMMVFNVCLHVGLLLHRPYKHVCCLLQSNRQLLDFNQQLVLKHHADLPSLLWCERV